MAGMVLTFSAASEQLDLSAKRSVVLRDLEGSTPSLGAKGYAGVREREEGKEGEKVNVTVVLYLCCI